MFEKKAQVEFQDPYKLRERQIQVHVQVKGDFWVGEATSAKAVMIK